MEEKQEDWDEHLPYVMMDYRSAQHESTKLTPNMLMLGREVSLPLDLVVGSPGDERDCRRICTSTHKDCDRR